MWSLPGSTFPLTAEAKEESKLQTSALLLPRLKEPLFPCKSMSAHTWVWGHSGSWELPSVHASLHSLRKW